MAACRGPRVIPRDKLTDIYYDMFMADQKIREFGYPSAMIDTMSASTRALDRRISCSAI